MRSSKLARLLGFAAACAGAAYTPLCAAQEKTPRFRLESYPAAVLASRQSYHKRISTAGSGVTAAPFYLIVPTLQRWNPGQTVRFAFLGGTPDLHQKIATAATKWLVEGKANLTLSFKDQNGAFRSWSKTDDSYSAEIRIAFDAGADCGGYWSHVGTDSANRKIVGGLPNQASMNLDSFDRELPWNWEGVVIHEFGHALGFEHEHQNPVGGCDFRFEDDAGYVDTTDAEGWFITDENGKRPGLYTFMGGYSNYWPKEKVDSNLRSLPVSSAFLQGPFDKMSIMKYFFNSFMFVAGEKSPCYTPTENAAISAQDAAGAQRAYPKDKVGIEKLNLQKRMTLEQLRAAPTAGKDLKQQINIHLDNM